MINYKSNRFLKTTKIKGLQLNESSDLFQITNMSSDTTIKIVTVSVVLIVYAIYELYINSLSGKVRDTKDAISAIKIRKKIYWLQRLSLIIAAILIMPFIIVLSSIFEGDPLPSLSDFLFLDLVGIFLMFAFMMMPVIFQGESNFLHISWYSKESFLKRHSSFSLYLRAFEVDSYTAKTKWYHRLFPDIKTQRFAEHKFASANKHQTICTIGLPEETEAPYGATRVYVENDTWKSEVHELMQLADKIYILLSNRESCLWEIQKSTELLNKTVFIVEPSCDYPGIRTHLNNIIDLPILPQDHRNYAFQKTKTGWSVAVFENSRKDYRKLLSNALFNDSSKKIDAINHQSPTELFWDNNASDLIALSKSLLYALFFGFGYFVFRESGPKSTYDMVGEYSCLIIFIVSVIVVIFEIWNIRSK